MSNRDFKKVSDAMLGAMAIVNMGTEGRAVRAELLARKYWPSDTRLSINLHDALCCSEGCDFTYTEGYRAEDEGEENGRYRGMAITLMSNCSNEKLITVWEILQGVAEERLKRRSRRI